MFTLCVYKGQPVCKGHLIKMIYYILVAILILWTASRFLRSLKIKHNYGDLHVIVTGCDSGFGRMLVHRLDQCGFNVFAACFTKEGRAELHRTTSQNVRTEIVDLENFDTISKFYETVKNTLPHDKALWALVNNAGVMIPAGPCAVLTKNDFTKSLNVNFFGMMEMTRHFIPLLRKSGGRIVNMSSLVGRLAFGYAPYAVSKYAVEAYSDCLRRELLYHGVSVHLLEPSGFSTPLMQAQTKDNIINNYNTILNNQTKEVREYYGPDYSYKVGVKLSKYLNMASKATYKVVDAYFHAITARYPKSRYVVGADCNTIFRLMWMSPEWFSDYLVNVFSIESMQPEGLPNKRKNFSFTRMRWY